MILSVICVRISGCGYCSSELIRRARRDGREARGNEEREKREDEKGSHCFFKSSGYDKSELKHQNLVFSSL